jgi:hypothetical protein
MKVARADVVLDPATGKCVVCGKRMKGEGIHYCRGESSPQPPKTAFPVISDGVVPAVSVPQVQPKPGVVDLSNWWNDSSTEIPTGAGSSPPPVDPKQPEIPLGEMPKPTTSPVDPKKLEDEARKAADKAKIKRVLAEGGVTVYKYVHRGIGHLVSWATGKPIDLSAKDEKDLAELGNAAFPLDVDIKVAYFVALVSIYGGHLLANIDGVISRFRRKKGLDGAKSELELARERLKQGDKPIDAKEAPK